MKKWFLFFLSCSFLFLSVPAFALDFSAHGYYRLWLEVSNDLDLQSNNNVQQGTQGSNNRFDTIFYGLQRFRLEPTLKVSDNISFQAQIDFLDDIVFGSNDTKLLSVFNPITGTIYLPGATGAFGVTGGSAGDVVTGGGGNINFRRFYVDLLTPIGKFRLGRQPSNWGLGIFQNDGNDWDSLFGDTFDRFLYIGKWDFQNGSNLAFATLVDFVYQNVTNPALNLLENPIIGASHNTYQFTQALLYQRPRFEIGTYAGFRFRNGGSGLIGSATGADGSTINPATGEPYGAVDGNTRAFYIDGYLKWEKGPIRLQTEYVYLGGEITTGVCINALQVPAGTQNALSSPVCLNGPNNLSVNMGALELDGKHGAKGAEEWKMISGFAQGDSSPLSSTITQFGFRPDYHVALLMFQEPLGTSPAIQVNGVTQLGNKPVTSNFVNNAAYVGFTYKHKFDLSRAIPQAQWLKVGAHVLTAWAPSRVFDINFAELSGISSLPRVYNASSWYGIETDIIIESRFLDHIFWNLTGAYFVPGAAYDIKNDDLLNATLTGNPINAIIFDKADPAFAIRSTMLFEF